MDIQKQIAALEQAIVAQEALRSSLGDEIVEQSISTLREKLAELQTSYTQERKLVTCMFCDVVASTRLAAGRDPEEVLKIIDGALQVMRGGVEQYGGMVARYMGDGVLALFGAPQALEQHAERAIQAALVIQRHMSTYAEGLKGSYGLEGFSVRVGINSGYVIAGRIAGGEGEYTVIGDAINVAARYEAAAPPGGILVGESTFRLAGRGRLFTHKTWKPVVLKGVDEPVPVYQILGLHDDGEDRASFQRSRSPFVGREIELKLVKEKYQTARDDRKLQVVEIVGPAGIGKSRLRVEFVDWLRKGGSNPHIWLGRATRHDTQTPYHVAGDLLRSALGTSHSKTLEGVRQKLEEKFDSIQGFTSEYLQAINAVLGVETAETTFSNLPPQSRRNVIVESFVRFCAHYAEGKPLVLILEDTHWADDLSLELVSTLVEPLSDLPLFILLTTRPLPSPDSSGLQMLEPYRKGSFTRIELDDLSLEKSKNLLEARLQSSQIPDWVTETILERGGGNPFYIEEIVNVLIESGALRIESGEWQGGDSAGEIHVPDTVQGVLAARIDRLTPDLKRVLQHAAIIGRTFGQELLSAILNKELDGLLASLRRQDFIIKGEGAALVEDIEWSFRHIMVQEVAYESVLKDVRQKVHRRIAEWLEERGVDRLDELAPTLARHYLQGGVWDNALKYLTQAADRSRSLFALREALRFLDQAMHLVDNYPGLIEKNDALRLQKRRGEVRGLSGEFEGAVADLNQVLVSVGERGDPAWERSLLIQLGMVYRRADDYEVASEHLNRALKAARESGDRKSLADTLYHLGTVVWSQGENALAMDYHLEAVEICRELGLRDLVAVQALHGLGEAYGFAGLPEKGNAFLSESLTLAREIGDKSYEAENLQMIAMFNGGWIGIGDYSRAMESGMEALGISRAARLDWHTGPALNTVAVAFSGVGDYQNALDYQRQALEINKAIGSLRFLSIDQDYFGSLYQDLNLLEKAEIFHKKGVETDMEVGSGFYLPRLQANLAIDRLRQGDLDVGDQLHKALTGARSRGQGIHAVRCLEGLAEYSVTTGDHQAALSFADELLAIAEEGGMREMLAQAYRWRGEAITSSGEFEVAELDLQRALEMAGKIGKPRLLWDIHDAHVKLYKSWGQEGKAEAHVEEVRWIVKGIKDNLKDPELREGLPEL